MYKYAPVKNVCQFEKMQRYFSVPYVLLSKLIVGLCSVWRYSQNKAYINKNLLIKNHKKHNRIINNYYI